MAKKRKAPSSQLTHEEKPKAILVEEPEQALDEEEQTPDQEEEVEEDEQSSSKEEGSESEDEDGENEEEEDENEEEEDEDEEEEEVEEEVEEEEEEEEDEPSSSEEEPIDDASKRETVRQLLEPFAKSQIIDLIKQAASTDPNILSRIVEVAHSDPTHRKIFVRGIGWDATPDHLVKAFAPFGEIEDSKLITDRNTGLTKGYAFVLFKTRAATKKALKAPQIQIASRIVSCQLAALGPPSGTAGPATTADRKLYVGNVAAHVSPEKLREFFGKFGEIEEGPIGMDPVTNKFKGFAIITYKSPEGYLKAIEEPVKVFDNCQLHCKKFLENQNKNIVNPSVTNVNFGGFGTNLNMGGFLMGQNPGIGLAGNAMLAAGYNPAAYNPTGLVGSGLSSTPMIPGMSGSYGVMGNYGSQAALHGLGAFQNAQTGQSSLGTAGITSTRTKSPTSGVLAPKTFTSYYGR